MARFEEEKDVLVKRKTEVVPVHSTTRKRPESLNNKGRSKMKISQEESKQSFDDSEHIDLSNWLWGGSFGDKKTLLVFRSCVLVPKKYAENGEGILEHDDVLDPFGSPVNERKSRSSANSAKPKNEPHSSKIKNKIRSKIQQCTMRTPLVRNPSDRRLHDEAAKVSTGQIKNKLSMTSKSSSLPSAMDHLSYDQDCSSLDSIYSFTSTFENNENIPVPNRHHMPAAKLNIRYKTAMAETKLLSKMLHAHGFNDVDSQSNEFNILWTGVHPKPDMLRSLTSYQRVNHFPRSYELTRKDKLFKNIEKMQYTLGFKNFDFIPLTFLMPLEYRDLCSTHYRIKGPWIVKPAASSRGRGIYIVNNPDQIPKGESVVVAKYIDKPLLVNGHKCDLRLYVCVTSFDPLLIYMYEEGLARFATVKYDKTNKSLWNPCMHLCNYSINKYHSDYVKCDDPSVENVGHKWTLSAFLRHLKKEGYDTANLMTSIEDVVIKSIFSCAHTISTASRMFVPYFSNCFELFGFDILIDENLKPWLLEINLSPSLGCDTPLDVRLKAALLVDTLNLVGVPAVDPTSKGGDTSQRKRSADSKIRLKSYRRVHSAENMASRKNCTHLQTDNILSEKLSLSNEEIRMIKYFRSQYERRGGYVRIFPSQDSWRKYSQYLDQITGVPISSIPTKNLTFNSFNNRNLNLLIHAHVLPHFDKNLASQNLNAKPPDRLKRYERVLPACNRVSLESASSLSSETKRYSLSATKKLPSDNKSIKTIIKQHIQQGSNLTQEESRRAFAIFLSCVLRRITKSTTDQSIQHAEWIMRFLKKVSHSLKLPYTIKVHSQKMSDKDKTAVIAKQLNDFLHVYHKETDIYSDTNNDKKTINRINFDKFICNASEADLEDILLAVLKAESNTIPFLGDKQSPMCFDIPPSTSNQFFNKELPVRHQLLRYLVYVTPLHSRRFKPFGIERTVLPPIVSDTK